MDQLRNAPLAPIGDLGADDDNFRRWIKFHFLYNPGFIGFIAMASDVNNRLFRIPLVKTAGVADTIVKVAVGLIMCPSSTNCCKVALDLVRTVLWTNNWIIIGRAFGKASNHVSGVLDSTNTRKLVYDLRQGLRSQFIPGLRNNY